MGRKNRTKYASKGYRKSGRKNKKPGPRFYIAQKILGRAYIKSVKKECAMCGSLEDLTFHHKENKIDNVSDLVQRGTDLIVVKREVAKCIVLCRSCHDKVHGV